jgi:hypothetical protein
MIDQLSSEPAKYTKYVLLGRELYKKNTVRHLATLMRGSLPHSIHMRSDLSYERGPIKVKPAVHDDGETEI